MLLRLLSEAALTSIKLIQKPMPLLGDLILGLVAKFSNRWGDVQETTEFTINVVGGTVGDEEFLRAFVFDGQAK